MKGINTSRSVLKNIFIIVFIILILIDLAPGKAGGAVLDPDRKFGYIPVDIAFSQTVFLQQAGSTLSRKSPLPAGIRHIDYSKNHPGALLIDLITIP